MDSQKNNEQEEKLDVCFIPKNATDTGRTLNGLVKTRNLVEAGIIAAPMLLLFYFLPIQNFITKVQCMIIFGGIPFFAGIYGVPPYSLMEYINMYLRFRRQRHYAKYNARLKWEITPDYLVHDIYETPYDKLMKVLDSFRSDKTPNTSEISDEIENPHHIEFFRDDEGIIELPDNLKPKAQLKAEARERKRAQKEAKRQLKRAKKQENKTGANSEVETDEA